MRGREERREGRGGERRGREKNPPFQNVCVRACILHRVDAAPIISNSLPLPLVTLEKNWRVKRKSEVRTIQSVEMTVSGVSLILNAVIESVKMLPFYCNELPFHYMFDLHKWKFLTVISEIDNNICCSISSQ